MFLNKHNLRNNTKCKQRIKIKQKIQFNSIFKFSGDDGGNIWKYLQLKEIK